MKYKDLLKKIDTSKHYIYTKQCEKAVMKKLCFHYGREGALHLIEDIQKKFLEYLTDLPSLGGKKNFHNTSAGANMDCLLLFAYYETCKGKTSVKEVEEIEMSLFLPAFKFLSMLKFINMNKKFVRKLMYKRFVSAQKACEKAGDYDMVLDSYTEKGPLSYHFKKCPIADFAKAHKLTELMPAMCNPDYAAMQALHAKLIRCNTCSNGNICDYRITGDKDPFVKEHPEYIDDEGYRRNK